jgi:hypothetical protein
MELRLGVCKTSTILDYRLVVFGDFSPYVLVRSVDGRRAVAKAERWRGCVGVSRELALYLYPYYGWGRVPVEADFIVEQTEPQPARRVVMVVPFGITEAGGEAAAGRVPSGRGSVALEYLEHIEFGDIASVEPPMSVLTDSTQLKIIEKPVEDDAVVFGRK